jgi:hypothetical protein
VATFEEVLGGEDRPLKNFAFEIRCHRAHTLSEGDQIAMGVRRILPGGKTGYGWHVLFEIPSSLPGARQIALAVASHLFIKLGVSKLIMDSGDKEDLKHPAANIRWPECLDNPVPQGEKKSKWLRQQNSTALSQGRRLSHFRPFILELQESFEKPPSRFPTGPNLPREAHLALKT